MRKEKLFKVTTMVAVFVICMAVMTGFTFAGKSAPKGNAFGWHGDRP